MRQEGELSQGVVDTVVRAKKARQTIVDGLITHAPLVLRFIVVLLLRMGIMIVLLSMSQRFIVQAEGLTHRFSFMCC